MDSGEIGIPIWAKLTAFAGLLIVPTVLVGWVLMQIASSTLKTNGRDYRLALAEDISETVESALRDGQDGLVGVAQMLSNPRVAPKDRIPMAFNVVESSELLDHAHVFDKSGGAIDVIVQGKGDPPVAVEKLPVELRKRARETELAVGGVVAAGESVRALTAVPIRADGKVTGYVASHLPLRPIQKRVSFVAEYRISSSQNPVYVVDEKLRVIAHPEKTKALKLESAPKNTLLENLEGEKIRRGVAQSGEFETEEGRRMLATVQPLQGLPWAVVIQEPLEVAYASLYRMRRIVWTATGIALAVAMGLSFLLGRSLTGPIDRLVEKARQLAERDFDREVDPGTNDELKVLGEAMNRAGRDLKASEERIREETEIRSDLGRYLPAELVDGIVERNQSIELGGKRQTVTVLFVDIVRFTPLCDELEAEAVVSILNELFTILTEIVFRHDGTVDKFIGDSVMAFWGAPQPIDDHADRALEAAEDMIQWLDVGNARWKEQYDVEIDLAVGVHTGEVIVGNVGSETRMEYTVIGRNVNVAARLEALANPRQILTTPQTKAAVGPGFEMQAIGTEAIYTDGGEVEILEVIL